MVLQKRLEYGFNGYQVPPTPRAPRSARRRVSSWKKNEDNTRMCAFDLLATVAGKLLQEGGNTSANKLKQETEKVKDFNFKSEKQQQIEEEDHLKVNICDQGSCNRSFFVSEIISQAPLHDSCSGSLSGITVCAPKSVNGESQKLDFSAEKVIVKAPFGCKVDDANNKQMSGKTQVVNNVNLVTRDDDENSSGRTQPPYTTIRSNDEVHLDTDVELKPVHRNRKTCYKWQRSLRDYPLKKRRLYELENVSNSDGVVTSDNGSNSSRKESGDGSSFGAKSEGGTGTSGFSRMQIPAFQVRDSHVKLKIESFMVPELFIEIPENTTVGSLKRTVMEAVTAILRGELHVGVMLQGKKIRDDNKTLLQSGISHDYNQEALSFILEPNQSQILEEDHSLVLPRPLTRYPPGPDVANKVVVKREVCDASPDYRMTNLNFVESDHDSAPSPPIMSVDNKSVSSSRALVTVPPVNTGALAVVPVRKLKRSEVAQRRIRRPFSVSEVEALVQAVEKLGTGRWRDVKLRAFEYAKHRTYVDLKDKWKTLVHTARISPQQRRGEPVPQELLDRVLAAHAYWSHHQAKQQFKQNHQQETCRLL